VLSERRYLKVLILRQQSGYLSEVYREGEIKALDRSQEIWVPNLVLP